MCVVCWIWRGDGLAWAQAVLEKTCATTEEKVKSDVWGFFINVKTFKNVLGPTVLEAT